MTDNSEYDETQWTAGARSGFKTAGADLLAAISAHIDFLSTAGIATPWEEIGSSNSRLERAAIAYAHAQFELTGNFGPLGEIEEWDEDEDDDEDDDDEALSLSELISVLHRSDYAVIDVEAVMTAGQEKFLTNRPGTTEVTARSEVNHLGAALYELAHADGWEALGKAPGLSPIGSIVQVLVPDEPIQLGSDAAGVGELDPAFSVNGRVLYTEENHFGY